MHIDEPFTQNPNSLEAVKNEIHHIRQICSVAENENGPSFTVTGCYTVMLPSYRMKWQRN